MISLCLKFCSQKSGGARTRTPGQPFEQFISPSFYGHWTTIGRTIPGLLRTLCPARGHRRDAKTPHAAGHFYTAIGNILEYVCGVQEMYFGI